MRTARGFSVLLVLALLFAGGCDRAKDAWSSWREGPEAEAEAETELAPEADPAAALERERQLAEQARLAAERTERERLAAEARRKQLEDADAAVARWAERLAGEKTDNGAFVEHEGLTEDDPWAKPIRVHYVTDEDSDAQTLEVRSAGPNGSFEDDDDLVRTRTTTIERPWFERNKFWVLGAFAWIGLGFISAGGLRRRRHRKSDGRGGNQDGGLDAADVLLSVLHIVFAPLTMLFWLLVLIIEVVGEIAD